VRQVDRVAPSSVREVVASPGSALDPVVRGRMEARLGHDFHRVRVHADEHAAASTEAIGARAYTLGHHVVFARHAYAPTTARGQALIAHELAHVAQWGDRDVGRERELRLSSPHDAAEQAAESAAQVAMLGQPAPVAQAASSGATVFRDNGEGGAKVDDQAEACKRIFAELGPTPMYHIVKRLEGSEKTELSTLRQHSALAEPYGRERLVLAMDVVWYAKFARGGLSEMRPMLQAEIDRIVPKATHGDQYEALTAVLHRPRIQAAPTGAPTPGKRGASSGKTAAPSEEEMGKWSEKKQKKWKGWLDTRDAKVQTFGAADYDDYVGNTLVSGGSVFGRSIPASNPVHPLFLDRLEAASAKARTAIGSDDFGVRSISGQDNRPGNHAWGLAVDIDPDANPYILNEAGDVGIDERVAPVYQRIAQALLHRDSVITRPTPKTKQDPGSKSGLEGASYTKLAEESDAMVAYFSVLPTPPPAAAPAKGKKAAAPAALPAPRTLTSVKIEPADIAALDKARVQADSDILAGKGERKGTSGDLPFEGAGAGRWRDPRRGFLSIRKEVVDALRGEGLRWGATDFPGASGDVMHFDDNDRHADYVAYGKAHPTAKRGGAKD
jgi:Domain of unknown function (DUF4157)